jgi:hypothetical protein
LRLQFPDFERSEVLALPPPRPFDPPWFAPMAADRGYCAEWWKVWKVAEKEARCLLSGVKRTSPIMPNIGGVSVLGSLNFSEIGWGNRVVICA